MAMRHWVQPYIFFSSNWLSLSGVVLVTTATVLGIFLLPTLWEGSAANPYLGIVIFLLLPVAFFAGLTLIPLGIALQARKFRRQGRYPESFPPLDLNSPELRRILIFVALTTIANMAIGGQFSYSAVTYMESVEFCGLTCHTVMKPEYTAYQNSPHSRVECVKCHIGPGASWFVKSKLSGAWQVVSVNLNLYPTPIPAPVENLRPARETCEACHWPQKYGGDRLKVISKFADDEKSTRSETVLMMRIGGGSVVSPGIHGFHLGPGVTVRYRHSDRERQQIPWVEYTNAAGKSVVYKAPDAKDEAIAAMPLRVMDCMDCHNRPSHTFQLPERAVDEAMAAEKIPLALPFARKRAVEALRAASSEADAGAKFAAFFTDDASKSPAARGSIAVSAIFGRNVFPAMKIGWGQYPTNIGHTDFPGCFRCHDDAHASTDGRKISQDCSSCHGLLAMEETSPKILSDLGVAK